MRSVAFEPVPASDGARLQLVTTAYHVEVAARLALPDRQGQSPVALLGDHPVGHVHEPVDLAVVAEAGDPVDLVDDVHDLVAQAALFLPLADLVSGLVVDLAHRDVPLVDDAEQQSGAAAPAMWVAVRVRLEVIEVALLLEILDDALGDGVRVESGQPPEPVEVVPVFVERRDDREADRPAQLVVLGTTPGRDVDDARALFLAALVPRHDAMLVAGGRERIADRL